MEKLPPVNLRSLSTSPINLSGVSKISTSPINLPPVSLSESPIKLLKPKRKVIKLTPLLPISEEEPKREEFVPPPKRSGERPKTSRKGRPKSGGRKTRKRKSRKRKSRKNKN